MRKECLTWITGYEKVTTNFKESSSFLQVWARFNLRAKLDVKTESESLEVSQI